MGPDQPSQPYQPSTSATQHLAPKKKSKGKKFLMFLLVLLLMAGAAAAGWYYRDMQAKDDEKVLKAEITSLKASNAKLKDELAAATAANAAARVPSEETIANIKAAVESGNFAALESLMSNPVTVILAASEGLGERTPTQAVTDLDYLDAGTDPWDFALTVAVLDGYRAGDYAKYFPQTALVGKSANNYVVSFSFDNDGEKIATIFMTNSADTL